MDKREVPQGLTEIIRERGTEVRYKSGELIYKQNSPLRHFYIIDSGLVKVFRETKNQREIILDVCGPGGFPGLLALWNGQVSDCSVVAVETTQIILVESDLFKVIFLNNTNFANYLFNIMSSQSVQVVNRLISINQKQLPGRVADLILFFYNLYNQQDAFRLPLNRKEMAQFAGTTKESLIRTLSEFKNDRIIELDDREVSINSMEIIRILSRLG